MRLRFRFCTCWVFLAFSCLKAIFCHAEKDTEPVAKPRAKPAAKKAPKKVVELDDSDDEDFTTSLRERLASYNAKVTQPSVVIGEFLHEKSLSISKMCSNFVLHMRSIWIASPTLKIDFPASRFCRYEPNSQRRVHESLDRSFSHVQNLRSRSV